MQAFNILQTKPMNDQVVVIFGASRGIGRATAKCLAMSGAKVVVAARSQKGLHSLTEEIKGFQGQATAVVADVTKMEDVKKVAETTMSTYGRIDTWVHSCSILLWAKVMDTTEDEFHKMMSVNFLGAVRSAQVAIPHLKRQGGSLIFVSSVSGVRAAPLSGAWAASMHALEGMIESLRVELMQEGSNVSVTSIRPGTVHTPLYDMARNKVTEKMIMGPIPRYDPQIVASSIKYAATHPGIRDLASGTSSWLITWMQCISPMIVDFIMLVSWPLFFMHESQAKSGDNWDQPIDRDDLNHERGSAKIMMAPFSVYNMIRERMSVLDFYRNKISTAVSRFCAMFS